jgi:hypothetical protein
LAISDVSLVANSCNTEKGRIANEAKQYKKNTYNLTRKREMRRGGTNQDRERK